MRPAPTFGDRIAMLATKLQRRILRALEAACAVKLGDDTFVEKWIVHGARGNSQDIAVTLEWSNKAGYVGKWILVGSHLMKRKLAEMKFD